MGSGKGNNKRVNTNLNGIVFWPEAKTKIFREEKNIYINYNSHDVPKDIWSASTFIQYLGEEKEECSINELEFVMSESIKDSIINKNINIFPKGVVSDSLQEKWNLFLEGLDINEFNVKFKNVSDHKVVWRMFLYYGKEVISEQEIKLKCEDNKVKVHQDFTSHAEIIRMVIAGFQYKIMKRRKMHN